MNLERRLQFQNLVVVAIRLNGVVQLPQEFGAIASEKVDAGDAALLQALVGIKRLTQSFRVASYEFAF